MPVLEKHVACNRNHNFSHSISDIKLYETLGTWYLSLGKFALKGLFLSCAPGLIQKFMQIPILLLISPCFQTSLKKFKKSFPMCKKLSKKHTLFSRGIFNYF